MANLFYAFMANIIVIDILAHEVQLLYNNISLKYSASSRDCKILFLFVLPSKKLSVPSHGKIDA